ncbi:hypothetical protein L2E82_11037 [Cichorium intybus]|uniref:Uncharacterized protein n=1 Tax=Cichorium intybus TaxID=13427 RepID=A0ACB9GD98_CICIN|nr:hypothetical protein L2E82_11037 [Cichorium intybus]
MATAAGGTVHRKKKKKTHSSAAAIDEIDWRWLTVAAGRQCRLKVEAVLDAKAARRKSEKELVAGDVLLAAAGGEDGWLGRCWD